MTFTPGPWFITTPNNDEYGQCGISDENYTICDLQNDGYGSEQQKANARLIAKAPEMYEVIKRYLGPPTIILQELDDKAEALIAEIEGD